MHCCAYACLFIQVWKTRKKGRNTEHRPMPLNCTSSEKPPPHAYTPYASPWRVRCLDTRAFGTQAWIITVPWFNTAVCTADDVLAFLKLISHKLIRRVTHTHWTMVADNNVPAGRPRVLWSEELQVLRQK